MGRKSVYLDNLRRYGETDVPETDVESLRKQFTSLSDALDETPSELGASHYKKAKQRTLTLRNIKRKKLPDLMAVFEKGIKLADEEEEETPKNGAQPVNQEEEKRSQEKAAETNALVLVESDKELAVLIIDVVHEAFYNPKTGFWPTYDQSFDAQSYRKAGKPGWDAPTDTPERQAARDEINRLKNLETAMIMENEFVKSAGEIVQETLLPVVSGVKARDIKHAIRNHVRDHLHKLIFGDSK